MSIINKAQGAVKQSEIATDEALSTLQTSQNEDALTVVKQLQSLVADSINKGSYLMLSEGRIAWDGTNIKFDAEGFLTDIKVKILQNQVEADAFSVDLKLVASLTNDLQEFNSIELLDNEVLYIEIDRPELLSSGGSIDLQNAVGGLSNVPHFTVKKAFFTPSAGMPKITSNVDGDVTPSLYIPLAYARTYTIGTTVFKDIWWIPHGIRWPENTTSTLGAVIVEGVETYPNKFVASYTDLQFAVADLSAAGGGVILITEGFSIDSNITIPKNVTMMSRGDKALSFINGGRLICEDGSTLKDFQITTVAGFNNASVVLSGNRVVTSNIEFDFTNSVDNNLTKAVEVSGDLNRIERCSFDGFGTSVEVEDTAFYTNLGSGFNSQASEIAIQPDNKILVGGVFSALNGNTRNKLVRLNTDGTEDTAFYTNLGSGFDNNISSLVIQPDNKILVGGAFINLNSNARNSLVRLNANGTEDTAFYTNLGSGFNSSIDSTAIQPDGKILVGGQFTDLNGNTKNRLVRLNADGTEDTAFYTNLGSGLDNRALSIVIQPDNKILIGGIFTTLNGNTRNGLFRLNADGTEDTAFYTNLGSGFTGSPQKITIQPDNKILVGGGFTTLNGNTKNRLVRLNADGTEDTAFYTNLGSGFDNTVADVVVHPSGKILVSGYYTTFDGNTRNRLVMLNADGTEDTAFYTNLGSGFNFEVVSMQIQTDQKILVGGFYTLLDGNTRNRLVRLNAFFDRIGVDYLATAENSYDIDSEWL